MSPEDAALVKTSKKLFTRGIVCIECGSSVYAYRDNAGRPRLIEHTDRRTVNSKRIRNESEGALTPAPTK